MTPNAWRKKMHLCCSFANTRDMPVEGPAHARAEILDVDIEACMQHPALSSCCRIIDTLPSSPPRRPPADFRVYYLNPKHGHMRRAHMQDQLRRSGVRKESVVRVEAITFPPGASKLVRTGLLSKSHSIAWQRALLDHREHKRASGEAPPGAVFMEDDVCLLSGWRRVLESLTSGGHPNPKSASVIRFDTLPHFESASAFEPGEGSVFAFPCVAKYCGGAYYMSWEAIRRALRMYKGNTKLWDVYKEGREGANEHITHTVGQSFGMGRYLQCVPPLAVQTWFVNTQGLDDRSDPSHHRASELQVSRHMLRLRTTVCASLLGEHGHRYHMKASMRNVMGQVLRGLYALRSAKLYPVMCLVAPPEWIWVRAGGDPSRVRDDRVALTKVSENHRTARRSITRRRRSVAFVYDARG